jgi:ornithine cyclodeaminase/alanine dehydrogenase-like protein (mu-crystallin family)
MSATVAARSARVYAELGQIVNRSVAPPDPNKLIVVDLTGTGAQDAAIGQVAWQKLGRH